MISDGSLRQGWRVRSCRHRRLHRLKVLHIWFLCVVNVWLYGFWSDPSRSLLALLVFFLVLLLNLEFQGLIVVQFHHCHPATLGTLTSLLARRACG